MHVFISIGIQGWGRRRKVIVTAAKRRRGEVLAKQVVVIIVICQARAVAAYTARGFFIWQIVLIAQIDVFLIDGIVGLARLVEGTAVLEFAEEFGNTVADAALEFLNGCVVACLLLLPVLIAEGGKVEFAVIPGHGADAGCPRQ
jgi:hypothetical protein